MPNQIEMNRVKENQHVYQQNHMMEMMAILKGEEEGQWLPLAERKSTGHKSFVYKQTSQHPPLKLSDCFLCCFCFKYLHRARQTVINHQEVCALNFNSYNRAKDRRSAIYICGGKFICGFCRFEASSRHTLTNHLLCRHKAMNFPSMKHLYNTYSDKLI